MPAIPSWLLKPLWDQFAALLPDRPVHDPGHPLGCHRRRIGDRIVSGKLLQVLRFGCSYEAIADCSCSATTIRARRDEWIRAGIFARLKQIALDRVLAAASRHDSPLLAPTLNKLDDLGPLPDHIRVHLDAGYDSQKTRDELAARGMTGQIAHKGDKAPIQAGQRWHVERTNAWHNAFNRLQRCYERRENVIDAYFDLADAVITVRSLIRQAWITYRWDGRPTRRP
jgi:transposase